MPMKPTATISLRIDPAQKAKIENWRRKHKNIPLMTDALRTLIDRGLAAQTRPAWVEGAGDVAVEPAGGAGWNGGEAA